MACTSLWKIAGLMEDLFLGSQWSIILGYRRLSVKFLLINFLSINSLEIFPSVGFFSRTDYKEEKEKNFGIKEWRHWRIFGRQENLLRENNLCKRKSLICKWEIEDWKKKSFAKLRPCDPWAGTKNRKAGAVLRSHGCSFYLSHTFLVFSLFSLWLIIFSSSFFSYIIIIFFLSVVWRFSQEIIFSPATTIKGREVQETESLKMKQTLGSLDHRRNAFINITNLIRSFSNGLGWSSF